MNRLFMVGRRLFNIRNTASRQVELNVIAFNRACKKSHPKNNFPDGSMNRGTFLHLQSFCARKCNFVANLFRGAAGLKKVGVVQYSHETALSTAKSLDERAPMETMKATHFLDKLRGNTNKSQDETYHLDRSSSDWLGVNSSDVQQGIADHIKEKPEDKTVIGDVFEYFLPANTNVKSIPVGFKCELNVKGYKASHGIPGDCPLQAETTAFLNGLLPSENGSFCVVGGNAMHALGAGATGVSKMAPDVSNGYKRVGPTGATVDCIPGGSSSGGTTGVVTGIIPVAIGSDGGGSARICPSGQGCVGVSTGAGYLDTTNSSYTDAETLVSPGFMGKNILNCAELAVQLNSNANGEIKCRDHSGLGVYMDLDSIGIAKAGGRNGQEIAQKCKGLFDKWLTDYRPDENHDNREDLHLHDLDRNSYNANIAAKTHITLFGLEESKTFYSELTGEQRSQADHELLLNMAMADSIPEQSIAEAKENRRLFKEHLKYLHEVKGIDVICMPTTLKTARAILPGERESGLADLRGALELSQFTNLANLANTAAITLPAGVDSDGMPIGFMLMSTTPDVGTNELFNLATEFQNVTREDDRFVTPAPAVDVRDKVLAARNKRIGEI